MRKRWVTGTAAVLMVALVVALWTAIAADLGSQNDPLITVGYINELMPSLMRGLDERVAEKTAELNRILEAQYREAAAELERQIAEFERRYADSITGDDFVAAVSARVFEMMGGGTIGGTGGEYRAQRVEVPNGRTLIGTIGTEIILRSGTATVVGSDPGLLNLTTGSMQNQGASLSMNNLYMVTVENDGVNRPRGFRATSNVVAIVIGTYVIQQ